MKKFLVILPVFVCTMAHAEFVTDLSKGWRFSVGPQFNFNASGRLGVKGGAIPLPAASFSSTRGAAKAAGDRISEGSWPLTLPNGAFVNPNDAAGIPGETWNWYVPAGQMNNGSMSFANAYSEHSTICGRRTQTDPGVWVRMKVRVPFWISTMGMSLCRIAGVRRVRVRPLRSPARSRSAAICRCTSSSWRSSRTTS